MVVVVGAEGKVVEGGEEEMETELKKKGELFQATPDF